jgi:leader peptidase (prepilin peptidase)/N-methyltransferase
MPLPSFLVVPLSALIGLLVGSFLASLVMRLPKGAPVVFDRSACPQCGHVLGPAELVPVLSWLVQHRRCRACGGKISGFYPLMEIASASIAAGAAWLVPWPEFVAICLLGWVALCLVAWAVKFRR